MRQSRGGRKTGEVCEAKLDLGEFRGEVGAGKGEILFGQVATACSFKTSCYLATAKAK